MKNYYVVFCYSVLLVLFVNILGCEKWIEGRDFKKAESDNAISAYDGFLAKHPNSEKKEIVISKIKELENKLDAKQYVQLLDSTYQYDSDDYHYSAYKYYSVSGSVIEEHNVPDRKSSKINGVTISGNIESKFRYRTVKLEISIYGESDEYENCALLGCIRYGGKEIDDSFYLEVAPGTTDFSKYYDLKTPMKGSGAGGALSGLVGFFAGAGSHWGDTTREGAGTPLNNNPRINIKIVE